MKKVAVLGSGNGSNFQAIVEYFRTSTYSIEFHCVSNKKDAYILERAKNLGIKSHFVEFKNNRDFLAENNYDLIVLAGYMRILPSEIVNNHKIINIHPSLLPKFKGMNSIEEAYNAKVPKTGVTVHYVDEGVDTGAVIEQVEIDIMPDITIEELEKKVHEAEHKLYPSVIEKILFGGLT